MDRKTKSLISSSLTTKKHQVTRFGNSISTNFIPKLARCIFSRTNSFSKQFLVIIILGEWKSSKMRPNSTKFISTKMIYTYLTAVPSIRFRTGPYRTIWFEGNTRTAKRKINLWMYRLTTDTCTFYASIREFIW